MEQLLEELLEASQPYTKDGKLADYIPELLKADPYALGIYVMRPDGTRSWAGDCTHKFTIQSVVKPILLTCGMYDGSGDFAVRVGIPAKSGVGGGIMAVAPTRMGIGIFGPALDKNGNSVAGIRLLEEFSHRMYLSIF